MPDPNSEDLRKLHREVNQIVNQRFVLMTAAVTLFGVIIGWQIPRDTSSIREIGSFTFAVSCFLMLMLFGLFMLTLQLSRMLRIFTTYLRMKGSQWEEDWANYRKSFSYFGYTRALTLLFLMLGAFTAAFPFGLKLVFGVSITSNRGAWICGLLGVAYCLLVGLSGFLRWGQGEEKLQEKWRQVCQPQSKE